MATEYDSIYFEHKKKIVIELVNQFRESHGYEAFPYELNQNNLNFEKLFCNPEKCSNCGLCCSTAPCIFSPHDFFDLCNIEYVKNILNTGLICISRSPEDEEILVLRPRGRQDKESVVSFTYDRNPCILVNHEGCMLPVQYRPCQGLLQIPDNHTSLILHTIIYPEYKCKNDYKPFQDILKILECEYYSRIIPIDENRMDEHVNSLIKSLSGKR